MEGLTQPKYWDDIWEKRRSDLPILIDTDNNYHFNRFDKFLKRYLRKGNEKLLEVGCGTSPF